MPDVLPERHLPWLLVVVVLLAEPFRIHPQLSSHLDLGMTEVMPLASIYPGLHLLARLLYLLGHWIHLACVAPSAEEFIVIFFVF